MRPGGAGINISLEVENIQYQMERAIDICNKGTVDIY